MAGVVLRAEEELLRRRYSQPDVDQRTYSWDVDSEAVSMGAVEVVMLLRYV